MRYIASLQEFRSRDATGHTRRSRRTLPEAVRGERRWRSLLKRRGGDLATQPLIYRYICPRTADNVFTVVR
jgi:hypothetical protein